LDRSKKLGDEVGIASTPTFFINGRRVGSLNMPPDVLKAVVDFEIAESGK
jgi:protein-disulfide isomerase